MDMYHLLLKKLIFYYFFNIARFMRARRDINIKSGKTAYWIYRFLGEMAYRSILF